MILTLVLIGFLSGVATGLSPCVLPVLPVIFAAGAAHTILPERSDEGVGVPEYSLAGAPALVDRSALGDRELANPGASSHMSGPPGQIPPSTPAVRAEWKYSTAVVGGLVLGFSAATVFGSWLLSLLGLPQDLLRDIGLAVLAVVGLGLAVPEVGDVLARPFSRITARGQRSDRGGFVLGLTSGLVFVPCAGPVLAAITVAGASRQFGPLTVVLTAAFAIGVAIPLLVLAVFFQRWVSHRAVARHKAAWVRRIAGVLLCATVLCMFMGWFDGLQRLVPAYTNVVQSKIEANASARAAIAGLQTAHGSDESLQECTPGSPVLLSCGPSPALSDISRWFNTAHDQPLTLAGLRGKVVLVDFWTYSCINCQRALPHVEAWAKRYARSGLVVIGVHTPEFAFEHVASNVASAVRQLGVTYPVAMDNNYATWNAFHNAYWPADYLIDRRGDVRAVQFGEGNYGATEALIRMLLSTSSAGKKLPSRTAVATVTPTFDETPESYLGYDRLSNLLPPTIHRDKLASYSYPPTLPSGQLALQGEWNVHGQDSVAGNGARLAINFTAKDMYLVAGGKGTIVVSGKGLSSKTIEVSGPPRLYQLVGANAPLSSTAILRVAPGISAYDLTFG